MANKQDEKDKVIKKDFLGDININKKELEKENEEYYSEQDDSKLLKMMAIKVARIERLIIYGLTVLVAGLAIVCIICS